MEKISICSIGRSWVNTAMVISMAMGTEAAVERGKEQMEGKKIEAVCMNKFCRKLN